MAALLPDGDHDSGRGVDAAAAASEALSAAAMTPGLSVPPHVPLLYMYGADDAKYARVADRVRTLYAAQARVVRVPAAGHNVFAHPPAAPAVCAAIAAFVSPVARARGVAVRVRDIRVAPYELSLRAEMAVGSATVRTRAGALVALLATAVSESPVPEGAVPPAGTADVDDDDDDDDEEDTFGGVGDVAPLPGLHVTPLAACMEEAYAWFERRTGAGAGAPELVVSAADILTAVDPAAAEGHGHEKEHVHGKGKGQAQGKRQAQEQGQGQGQRQWQGQRQLHGQGQGQERGGGSDLFRGLSSATIAALSAALLQCLAKANSMSTALYLSTLTDRFTLLPRGVTYNGVAPRPANSLWEHWGEYAEARARSSVALVGDAAVLKVKVGFASIHEDVLVVERLCQSEHFHRCSLRLDANCSWTPDDFTRFCDLTRPLWPRLEYIEEPCAVGSPEAFRQFCAKLYRGPVRDLRDPVVALPKIGLDESLAQFSVARTLPMVSYNGVDAIVLKPSVQGRIGRVFALAKRAESRGVKVILSSVFDSGVGLAWATVLAAAIGNPATAAHGVGTFTALVGDSVSPSFQDACVLPSDMMIGLEECEGLLERATSHVLRRPK